METPNAIPQAPAADNSGPQPSAVQASAAQALPWAPARPPRMGGVEAPIGTVHWSIVALTILTAISVLFGAYGRSRPSPQELLPIVVDAR